MFITQGPYKILGFALIQVLWPEKHHVWTLGLGSLNLSLCKNGQSRSSFWSVKVHPEVTATRLHGDVTVEEQWGRC